MAKRTKSVKKKPARSSSSMLEWFKASIIGLTILILLRFLWLDLSSYSDSSMEKSILPGDILVVNKASYGARMPMRVLPQSWVNKFLSTDTLPPLSQLPYWRLPGNDFPDYNHLVLLNIPAPHSMPVDQRSHSVKRLVGLPGDNIEMKNTRIQINGKPYDNPSGIQWNYVVEMKRNASMDDLLNLYQIREGSRLKGNKYVFSFTQQMADSIAKLQEVRKITRLVPKRDDDYAIPFGKKASSWTPDNFGPLVLPYKGLTIPLNAENTDLYLYHLLYHERVEAIHRNDSVFIDGKYADHYTFQYDYYFFLGDNRHNTSDSRLWGMVPEHHIIGQVTSVFLSFDKSASLLHKVRWKRLFQPIAALQ